jgi:hypothetical protein
MTFSTVNRGLSLALLLLLTLGAGAQQGSEQSVFQHPVNQSNAPKAFVEVRDTLSGAEVVRSQFKQKKTIKVLKKPIISQGNFIFSREQGLFWNIGQPINSSYVLTPKYMIERQKGFKPKVVTPDEQPALFGLTEIFEAIFVGDLKRLTQDFKIHFLGTSKDWTIGLIPQRGLLQKMFKQVVLKGDGHVKEVLLYEKNGDSTHLKFLGPSREPATLSSSEKALFAR